MPADVICGRNRHAEHKVDNDTLINEQNVKMLSKVKNAKKISDFLPEVIVFYLHICLLIYRISYFL